MKKLNCEQAVAADNRRGVDDVKSVNVKSMRAQFDTEKKRATGAPRRAAATTGGGGAAAADRRRKKDDQAPRDPAVSSVETSAGCQSNVPTVQPIKPMVKRTMSAPKFKNTSIPVRQLSHEVVMIKSPEVNSNDYPKTFVLCPSPTLISEPETEVLVTLLNDCHKDVQDDLSDDEHKHLKDNESMEQLAIVETIYDSSEVSDENLNFKTEELMENNTSAYTDEYVKEDILHVLEISDMTLVDDSEPNDDFVSSCLEAESIMLLEKSEDLVFTELSEESPKHSESHAPSLNNALPVVDSNQEKIESTKSLRARFEALNNDSSDYRPTSKANKKSKLFENQVTIKCESCEKKVYPLEKIEIGPKVYHKTCFRCSHCQCLLRMDTFTRNCDRLFCMTHFKQLFKIKGNYVQGFCDDIGRNWENEK